MVKKEQAYYNLFWNAANGKLDAVKRLIKQHNSSTPLEENFLFHLSQRHADVSKTDPGRYSPLVIATNNNHAPVVEFLLDKLDKALASLQLNPNSFNQQLSIAKCQSTFMWATYQSFKNDNITLNNKLLEKLDNKNLFKKDFSHMNMLVLDLMQILKTNKNIPLVNYHCFLNKIFEEGLANEDYHILSAFALALQTSNTMGEKCLNWVTNSMQIKNSNTLLDVIFTLAIDHPIILKNISAYYQIAQNIKYNQGESFNKSSLILLNYAIDTAITRQKVDPLLKFILNRLKPLQNFDYEVIKALMPEHCSSMRQLNKLNKLFNNQINLNNLSNTQLQSLLDNLYRDLRSNSFQASATVDTEKNKFILERIDFLILLHKKINTSNNTSAAAEYLTNTIVCLINNYHSKSTTPNPQVSLNLNYLLNKISPLASNLSWFNILSGAIKSKNPTLIKQIIAYIDINKVTFDKINWIHLANKAISTKSITVFKTLLPYLYRNIELDHWENLYQSTNEYMDLVGTTHANKEINSFFNNHLLKYIYLQASLAKIDKSFKFTPHANLIFDFIGEKTPKVLFSSNTSANCKPIL